MGKISMRFSRTFWHFLALLISSGFLGSCVSSPRTIGDYPLSAERPTYAEPGSMAFSTRTTEYTGTRGCTGVYMQFIPDELQTETTVVLTHGFMADLFSMIGWAELWASYGVPVTVITTCNSTWIRGRHRDNANDIARIARQTAPRGVVYAGFSSGGLATLLASIEDERTVAYLGLDAVDTSELGQKAAPRIEFPTLFVFGEPSACNAKNNMLPAVAAIPHARALRIREATHCHFENPYRESCESVCGSVEPPEVSTRIGSYVHAAATAWILLQTGIVSDSSEVIDRITTDERVAEVLK